MNIVLVLDKKHNTISNKHYNLFNNVFIQVYM